MIQVFEKLFDLAAGYALVHLAIWGLIGIIIVGVISAIVWFKRGDWLRVIPGVVLVVVVPLMVVDVLPGAQLGAPLALIAASITFLGHLRFWRYREHTAADRILTIASGASLCMIAAPFVYGALFGAGG